MGTNTEHAPAQPVAVKQLTIVLTGGGPADGSEFTATQTFGFVILPDGEGAPHVYEMDPVDSSATTVFYYYRGRGVALSELVKGAGA